MVWHIVIIGLRLSHCGNYFVRIKLMLIDIGRQ